MATGEPSDNLYVTNLPNGLDDSTVAQFFSIYGTVVSAKVLKNPIATGKTAALIRFTSVEEASSILQTLNGTVPTGLDEPVHVKFASRREPAKGAGKVVGGMGMPMGMGATASNYGSAPTVVSPTVVSPYGSPAAPKGGNGKEPEISDNIYVQGLPAGTTEESLQQTFMEFGTIRSVKLLASKGLDAPCAALIRYDSVETAKLTKEILNGQTPEGFPNPLVVRYANANSAGTSNPAALAMAHAGKSAYQALPHQPVPVPPPMQQQQQQLLHRPSVLTCPALVDMVYQSDMLPGGKKYFNERASLYVGGLPVDTTESHLYKMFSPYGAIHTCTTKIGGHAELGYTFVIGFVNYLDPLSAEAAITAYNGMSLPDGTQLKVTIKTKSGGK